ncbi:MAG: hypothetical protein Q9227_003947 [Pyrenula ochraceoflavens]
MAAPTGRSANNHVYLAGPSVFLENSTDAARAQIAACADLSFIGVHPLREVIEQIDGTLPPGAKSPDNYTDQDWYQGDLSKIRESAGIIAEISAFRGPSMDPGTAFELGYAVSRGLKVALWSDTSKTTYYDRVEADAKLAQEKGIPSDVLGPGKWAEVDTLNATENLMITRPDTPVYATFGDAAVAMAKLLGVNPPA